MVIHLGIQDALGERLFQAVEKAVRIEGRLRIGPSQKLVQDGIRNMRLFASRHGWAPFHPSCPPTHEIPDSLRLGWCAAEKSHRWHLCLLPTCRNRPRRGADHKPCEVVVLMPSVRERNATPLPFRSSKMRTRCESERPRRSSFQTPAHHLRAIRRGGSSGRRGCRAHVDDLGPALAAPDLSPKLLGLAVGPKSGSDGLSRPPQAKG